MDDSSHPTLSLPLAELQLSVRASNCLARAGVETTGELVRKTPQDLLAIRNMGVTTLRVVERVLAERGLRLGMDDQDLRTALPRNDTRSLDRLNAFLAALHATDVDRLSDLLPLTAEELVETCEIGEEDVEALQEGLAKWGLSLGLEITDDEHESVDESYDDNPHDRTFAAPDAMTFREEAISVVTGVLEGPPHSRLASFLAYHGLAGDAPTLDVMGKNGPEYGFGRPVTRERVRQILKKASKKLESQASRVRIKHWSPAVSKVKADWPVSVLSFLRLLGYEHDSVPATAYRRLVLLAELLNLDLPFALLDLGAGQTLLFPEEHAPPQRLSARLRAATRGGYAEMSDTTAELANADAWLPRLISAQARYEFLDADQSYFWRRPNLPPRNVSKTGNPILTSLCKVFSVADRAASRELARSLGRDRTVRAGGPPRALPVAVVEGVAKQSGMFDVVGGQIQRKADLPRWQSVPRREALLMQVARRYGRVISSKDLYSSLVQMGLSKGNATQIVQFSPFLLHTQAGVGEVEGVYKFVFDPERMDLEEVMTEAAAGVAIHGDTGVLDGCLRIPVSTRALQLDRHFDRAVASLDDGWWSVQTDAGEVGRVHVAGQLLDEGLRALIRDLHLKKDDVLILQPLAGSRTLILKPGSPI